MGTETLRSMRIPFSIELLGSAPGQPASSGGIPRVKTYSDGSAFMVAPAPSLDLDALGAQ
ncbi:hypothetical protein [Prauserella sp. PE36]|uniref:hypothetical protein n=1 Tax=Prauserella sp. PE36 TaxID=1504709 RepID=UPI001F206872|nr:hypothetical protein [Prauserella sp. PE36]